MFWNKKKSNLKSPDVPDAVSERLILKQFKRSRSQYIGDGKSLLKNICTWTHMLEPAEPGNNYSTLTCNKCDYSERFEPAFWDGWSFDFEAMNVVVWEHFIKCHEEILQLLIEVRDSIPGSRLIFAPGYDAPVRATTR